MCQIQTLYHDQQVGYVVRCPDCAKLQIGFGNLVLTLDPDGFDQLHRQVRCTLREYIPCPNKAAKNIMLHTNHEACKLILSEEELLDLHHMLEEADNERQARQLLELFQVP
ncbi:DUF6686 family protein [Paraflavisolibacter sp. H34]|uniref:DUF6686 family protein n=1 Tax=Huijunlia imazamoxiresistens TaxID=3127457 RepID=UPI003019B1CD